MEKDYSLRNVETTLSGPPEDGERLQCKLLYLVRLKTEKDYSLRNVEFLIIDKTTDNIQNCDNYINIPSSQT
jgi:hypothetical protein